MPSVELRVNGQRFVDWTRVSINRSITSVADAFSFGYIDTNTARPFPINDGDKCEVFIGSNRILTGYVDVADWGYSAGEITGTTNHTFSVEGRSKTADLVDSSVLEPKTWKKKTFKTIAEDICGPYDIPVAFTTNVDSLVSKPIARHSVEVGETAADCLGRLALKLGVLMRTDVQGRLEIGRPPSLMESSGLFLGNGGARIKSGSRRMSSRERHDLYVAFGQRQGSAQLTEEAAREGRQSATDARVLRYRPLVFVQDGSSDVGTLTRAAEWTRNIRAGQGQTVTYEVQGWEARPGQPWEIGKTVIVQDPLLRLERQGLIIESTDFTFARDQGSITQMRLVLPEAFQGLTPPSGPKERDGALVW